MLTVGVGEATEVELLKDSGAVRYQRLKLFDKKSPGSYGAGWRDGKF